MITYKTGNILDAQADALVNTVNTIGVMGKGIALQFKKNYPENTAAYTKAVKEGSFNLGNVLVVPISNTSGHKYIINFPTKAHWRNPSKLEWIKSGLIDLRNKLEKIDIESIALPPLGCGNGGLDWRNVKPIIEEALKDLPIEIQLYEPSESVKKILMQERQIKASKLTNARAMILYLLYKYRARGEFVSEFAAEKLSYFLQRYGEDQLKLNFIKGHYGPYSGKVRHVLFALNGYYISGYEQKEAGPFEELQLKVEKKPELDEFIKTNLRHEESERLQRVSLLIKGYESPYGMELLATVDFIAQQNKTQDPSVIKSLMWSDRKSELFSEKHIEKAIAHLRSSSL